MNTKILTQNDMDNFKAILEKNLLPVSDIGLNNQYFIGLFDNNILIGGIGIEQYQHNGLLRSMVVESMYRGKQLASGLYEELLDYCAKNNITRLYLLTQTAQSFFERKGWELTNRNEVPDDIKKSAEFSHICPSTAACMSITVTSALATHLFLKGFNCAQSVLTPFATEKGMSSDTALRMATGFGAGMVYRAETCGALTGAMMAIGLYTGRFKTEDTDARDFTYMIIRQLYDKFTQKHGSIICKHLLNLKDTHPESWQQAYQGGKFDKLCPMYVKDAAKFTEELIKQYHKTF